jgi:GT2 family glycosyltransferase
MIDVVIVNWNTGNLLRNCVDSIIKNNQAAFNKIIVVDNNSNDESETGLPESVNLKVIKNKINYGFAKGCNIGASHVKAKYTLFLNPDTFLYEDTFKKVLKIMESNNNSKIGICGIKLENEQGDTLRHCARIPSFFNMLCHVIALDRLFPKLGYTMGEWDHEDTQNVDHVIGAFLLVRTNLFKELKGFDERYFVYLEDLDFSLRAKQLGWECLYYAETKANHFCGGSSKNIKATSLFYSVRSRLLYSHKHFNRLQFILILVTTLFLEPLTRFLWSIKLFSFKFFSESFLSQRYLINWLFKVLLKKIKFK